MANDLPLDYYRGFTAQLEAIAAEDVQKAAQRTIDPDHFAVVVVGDRKEIESGIKALNEGEIVIRDLWGQPVP